MLVFFTSPHVTDSLGSLPKGLKAWQLLDQAQHLYCTSCQRARRLAWWP